MDAALEAWKQEVLRDLQNEGAVNLNEAPADSAAYADVEAKLAEIAAKTGNLQQCDNTANGMTDSTNDDCWWYDSNPNSCGQYDTETFKAHNMCCSCGGGTTGTTCHDTNTVPDSGGDECSWYWVYPDQCGAYDHDVFKANEHCCACGGGDSATTPLSPPEWRIDLDYEQGETYAQDLENAYTALHERMQHVLIDWDTDRKLIDNYYWNYELMPLLAEGEKLDERTLRTLITWIADGTQIKGKPLTEVFPEVEEYMLSNFNPDGTTCIEKFNMENMPMVLQEWEGADWFEFYDCAKRNIRSCMDADCIEWALQETCDGYDTWEDDFYDCLWNGDCADTFDWAAEYKGSDYVAAIYLADYKLPMDYLVPGYEGWCFHPDYWATYTHNYVNL